MEQDDEARQAEAAGLGRFWESHPEDLRFALKAAAALRRRLSNDLDPAEECAHIFPAKPPGEGQQ
ncbi:MAG: hypothetical protein R3D44_10040 [Hyphomicrobiaceae bacterium]